MKKFIFLMAAAIAFTAHTANAEIVNNTEHFETNIYKRGYGNSFIFLENGIEFSVFPDGQFDFNIIHDNPRFSLSIGSPNVNISFNSGYDYNAYVQYDEFGAIIQIENTPVFYDYYGRVSQVGNININYNSFGYVSRIGGLYVHYNNRNVFSHHTGFINVYNRRYVYRPWHHYYSAPAYNYCVVYNRPYRQYYKPVRYTYSRPFYNNYRPQTAIATRRGQVIKRNRNYATVNRSKRNVTKVNKYATSRRYASNDKRAQPKKSYSRQNRAVTNNEIIRRGNTASKIHTRNTSRSNNQKVITRTPRNINNVKTRNISRSKNNTVVQKPKSTNQRTYNRSANAQRPQKTVKTSKTTQRRTVSKAPRSTNTRAIKTRSSNNNTRSTTNRRRS